MFKFLGSLFGGNSKVYATNEEVRSELKNVEIKKSIQVHFFNHINLLLIELMLEILKFTRFWKRRDRKM